VSTSGGRPWESRHRRLPYVLRAESHHRLYANHFYRSKERAAWLVKPHSRPQQCHRAASPQSNSSPSCSIVSPPSSNRRHTLPKSVFSPITSPREPTGRCGPSHTCVFPSSVRDLQPTRIVTLALPRHSDPYLTIGWLTPRPRRSSLQRHFSRLSSRYHQSLASPS
jgi:hypothetical protein